MTFRASNLVLLNSESNIALTNMKQTFHLATMGKEPALRMLMNTKSLSIGLKHCHHLILKVILSLDSNTI